MPNKIKMFLSNGNYSPAQFVTTNISNIAAVPKKIPTALNSSIIGRIHTVKPGCGSCGRH